MRKIILSWLVLVALFAGIPSLRAGDLTLLGVGGGGSGGGGGYTGPGDIASGAGGFWSCARSYNAAYGTGNFCDLVAVTGGAPVCTLKGGTSGFVDLTAYCPGSVTPAAACAAASGGSCLVTKAYDQSGNGLHATQATLGAMPSLLFGALNGLPCMNMNSVSAKQQLVTSSITQAQPWTISSVSERTSGTTGNEAALVDTANSYGAYTGSNAAANTGALYAGSFPTFTVTDGAFHAMQSLFNTTSSAALVDSTANTGLSVGAGAWSATPLSVGTETASGVIDVCEAMYWNGDKYTANAAALNANQHGSTNGYNF
jgi:hypothetical protein